MSELGSASPVTEFTGKCGELWPLHRLHRLRRSGDTRPPLGQSICRAPRHQPDTGWRIFPDRLAGDESERYKTHDAARSTAIDPACESKVFPSEFYVMCRIVPRLCAAAISPRPPPGSTLRPLYGLASARAIKNHTTGTSRRVASFRPFPLQLLDRALPMAETHSTGSDRPGSTLKPPTPIWRRGEMYALADLAACFSKTTIGEWRRRGLRIVQPGTKQAFVWSDDLIDLFLNWDDACESASTDAPTE